MTRMFDKSLTDYSDYLAKAQALTNGSEAGNGNELYIGETLGGVEFVCEAVEEISLADTKVLTVTLQHKENGGVYSELVKLVNITASGATTIDAGTVIGRFVPPRDFKGYVKCSAITTDDAAVDGSISIYPTLNP